MYHHSIPIRYDALFSLPLHTLAKIPLCILSPLRMTSCTEVPSPPSYQPVASVGSEQNLVPVMRAINNRLIIVCADSNLTDKTRSKIKQVNHAKIIDPLIPPGYTESVDFNDLVSKFGMSLDQIRQAMFDRIEKFISTEK